VIFQSRTEKSNLGFSYGGFRLVCAKSQKPKANTKKTHGHAFFGEGIAIAVKFSKCLFSQEQAQKHKPSRGPAVREVTAAKTIGPKLFKETGEDVCFEN
jgi:hypothetical protein